MHQGSGQTIPELVRSIRENLENSPRALEVFNEKLFQTGYLDSEATWYERIGFHTLNQVAYHVEDGFPRISMETIPEGVGDLKYSLVLSTCSDFKVIPDPFTK
jgi:hypothetical protein